MKRRSIVVIPPGGTRIPSLRIRVSFLAVIGIVLLAGFAGYFIPFNSLSPDHIYQNQQRHLSNQNVRLLRQIRELGESTRRLDRDIVQLEQRRDSMASLAYLDTSHTSMSRIPEPYVVDRDSLLAILESTEHTVLHAISAIEKDRGFFDDLPVGHPVAAQSFVSSTFGERPDPFTGEMKMHLGVDFVAEKGSPVVATAAGKVTRVENDNAWGRRVVISHSSGFSTVYAHLGSVNVGSGRRVKKGDKIGTVGNSGITSGVHLHYEVRKKKTHVDPQLLMFPDLSDFAQSDGESISPGTS